MSSVRIINTGLIFPVVRVEDDVYTLMDSDGEFAVHKTQVRDVDVHLDPQLVQLAKDLAGSDLSSEQWSMLWKYHDGI